jgi:hypothetical protein
MKRILGVIVLGLLWCNISIAEEMYYMCVNKIVLNRGDDSFPYKVGQKFGITYFKLDTKRSKITIHEAIGGDPKPIKIGIKKIGFVGKDNVKIVFNKPVSGSKWIHTFTINSVNKFNKQSLQGFSFKANVYIKDKSSFWDFDYKNAPCYGPLADAKLLKGKDAKKLYKNWIKGK